MEQNNTRHLLIIAAKLLVICTIVAVIIAFVNSITKERIELNELSNTAEALSGIYSEDYNGNKFEVTQNELGNPSFVIKNEEGKILTICKSVECEKLKDITDLYVVMRLGGDVESYCVFASPMGFKDRINLLVAITPSLTVKSVKIVSLSDTSGIGTKVQEETFLSQFIDKSSVIGEVDTISGATKSSKPVINAVDTALKQVASYISTQGGNK